ncbi:SHD1 domain-containing protein [Rhodopirellula sallentina]|nr:SHD1 domain-containing protein [Rhodopirellula sallentina]
MPHRSALEGLSPKEQSRQAEDEHRREIVAHGKEGQSEQADVIRPQQEEATNRDDRLATALATSESTSESAAVFPHEHPKEQAGSIRNWVSADGRFRFEGSFQGREGDKIFLAKANSDRTITVKLNKLSRADVRWIEEHAPSTPSEVQAVTTVDFKSDADQPIKVVTSAKTTTISTVAPAINAYGGQLWKAFHVQMQNQDELTFGDAFCPIVVSGREIWSVEKGSIVSDLSGSYNERCIRAISPSGKWFATTDKSPNQTNTTVSVWNTETGEKELELPGDPDKYVDLLQLSLNKLYVGGRLRETIEIWDLQNGMQKSIFSFKGLRGKNSEVGISRDGRFAVLGSKEKNLVVVDTQTQKIAVRLQTPRNGYTGLPGRNSDLTFEATATSRSLSLRTRSLAFSPRGNELAMVVDEPTHARILCWDQNGKIILDTAYPTTKFAGDLSLKWFPNGKAFLVDTDVIDRTSGLVVVAHEHKLGHDPKIIPAGNNHIVGTWAIHGNRLDTVEIPWDGISQSIDTAKTGGSALLSPAHPCGVRVDIGDLRDGERVDIESALKRKLAHGGVQIDNSASSYYQIRVTNPDEVLTGLDRQFLPDMRGLTVNQRLPKGATTFVLEFVAEGEVIWREVLGINHGRDSRRLASSIHRCSMPYFIPVSDTLPMLPLHTAALR